MFVENIYIDHWEGNQDLGESVPVINWEQVEQPVKELDGNKKTLILLEREGGAQMGIGGCHDNYIVYITYNNEDFFNLIDDTKKSDKIVEVNTGGQYGEYPENYYNTLDKTLIAAKTFALKGEIEQSLTWVKE